MVSTNFLHYLTIYVADFFADDSDSTEQGHTFVVVSIKMHRRDLCAAKKTVVWVGTVGS